MIVISFSIILFTRSLTLIKKNQFSLGVGSIRDKDNDSILP